MGNYPPVNRKSRSVDDHDITSKIETKHDLQLLKNKILEGISQMLGASPPQSNTLEPNTMSKSMSKQEEESSYKETQGQPQTSGQSHELSESLIPATRPRAKKKAKMASLCEHTSRLHYSCGMCQNCYLSKYYLKRKKKQLEKRLSKHMVSTMNADSS
jgi:hypothetical protein